MTSFETAFAEITGFAPYPFQKRAQRSIEQGRNVILSVPTGCGKTWAAVAPFLAAKLSGEPVADRLLYALPLRSLASSIHRSVLEALQSAGRPVSDSPPERYGDDETLRVTLQTGADRNDPLFLGDVVFSTIDQLMTGYLHVPVSLSRRRANMIAGAIPGSLVVFDEIHLLEPGKSLYTLLEMMDRLSGIANFLLMTATLSEDALDFIRDRFDADRIVLEEDERASLKVLTQRQRKWTFCPEPVDADFVLHNHQSTSLVVCNTVRRAQELYRHLRDGVTSGTRVLLLHARFLPEDRKRIERDVMSGLARGSTHDLICVTTQVVEAGMDLSCDTLFTELAPANALVQRAGRCARFGGEGRVFVHEIVDPSKTAPYDKDTVERTREFMAQWKASPVSPNMEAAMVAAVHGQEEVETLKAFPARSWRDRVNASLDGMAVAAARQLVRDVDSVSVFIDAAPQPMSLDDGWPQTLSVGRRSLFGLLRNLGEGTLGQVPVERSAAEEKTLYGWKPLETQADIASAWLVCLSPDMASYDSDVGLLLGVPGPPPPLGRVPKRERERYAYRLETYEAHAFAVARRLAEYGSRWRVARERMKWPALPSNISIEEVLRLAGLLHDTGKLARAWQDGASDWQRSRGRRVPDGPVAHTDFDPSVDDPREFQRPPHAAEGAFACQGLLVALLGQDAALVCASAIARHHGSFSGQARRFELDSKAEEVTQGLLARAGACQAPAALMDEPGKMDLKKFPDALLSAQRFDDQEWLPLLWIVVRLMRIADEEATREYANEDRDS